MREKEEARRAIEALRKRTDEAEVARQQVAVAEKLEEEKRERASSRTLIIVGSSKQTVNTSTVLNVRKCRLHGNKKP